MLPRVARVLSLISYVLPVFADRVMFSHNWANTDTFSESASRQVAPLLRTWGEVCCRGFPCSQLYTNIYSGVKYRLYGSVFCKRVYTGHYFLYFKNRFSCFFRCSYDKQRYLTYMLIVE